MSLEYLIAKDRIERLYVRYCEIVDNKTFDDMTSIFVADYVGRYAHRGAPVIESFGVASLIEKMHENLGAGSNCGPTHHNVGNFRIEVAGNEAAANVHYYAEHLGVNAFEGELYSMWGEYDDDLVNTAEGWRVKNRRYRCFFHRGPIVTSRGPR